MLAALNSLWAYRGFVFGSVRREFQLRYRNTLLGIVWTVLHPLAMIFTYTLIFSQIMKSKLPGVEGNLSYSIYLCAGVIAWGLFSEIVQRSQTVFLDNANLLKKLNFPRLVLPLIVATTALLNFSIVLGLFLAFLLLTNNLPGWVILAAIPLLAVQVLFAMGLGIMLGVLNVFFRDVGQFSGLLLQFWFWATPIVYPASILPAWLRPWINLNPMYHIIQGYQNIFVVRQWPDWQNQGLLALLAILLVFYALNLFHRHVGDMVDEL